MPVFFSPLIFVPREQGGLASSGGYGIVNEAPPSDDSLECQKSVKKGIRNALIGGGISIAAAASFWEGSELNDWLRVALIPISAGGLLAFVQQIFQASSDQDWVKILGIKEVEKEKQIALDSKDSGIINNALIGIREKCNKIFHTHQFHTRLYALASIPFLASAGAIMVAKKMGEIKWDTAALAELPTLPFGALLFYIFWDMTKDSKKLQEELKKLSETHEAPH